MTSRDRIKQVAAGCVASLAVVDAHVWLGNAGTDALPIGIAFGVVGLALAAWLETQRRRAMRDAERAIARELARALRAEKE